MKKQFLRIILGGIAAFLFYNSFMQKANQESITIEKIEHHVVTIHYNGNEEARWLNLGVRNSDYQNKFLRVDLSEETDNKVVHRYKYPGVYVVKLEDAEQKVISQKAFIVGTLDWTGYCRRVGEDKFANPDRFSKDELLNQGFLSIPQKKENYSWVNLLNMRLFNLTGENFILEARFKNSEALGGSKAFDSRVTVFGETGNFIGANFVDVEENPSAHIHAYVELIDHQVNGKNRDMHHFGIYAQQWNIVKIISENHKVKYFMNDKHLETFSYPETQLLGQIAGLRFTFKGNGQLDWISLKSATDQSVIYQEDF